MYLPLAKWRMHLWTLGCRMQQESVLLFCNFINLITAPDVSVTVRSALHVNHFTFNGLVSRAVNK